MPKEKRTATEFIEEEVELVPPEPNVKFVGKVEKYNPETGKFEKVQGEPFPSYNTATEHITLPPVDEQKKKEGFYFEGAKKLATDFPLLYKLIKAKGE
jgi:hypothetical protein